MVERSADRQLTRQGSLLAAGTALLVIDAQNWVLAADRHQPRPEFYEDAHGIAVLNIRRLLQRSRQAGLEVVFTVIENLTADGRDRSLDYKLSDFFIAKGSTEARVIKELRPEGDEIVLPKTSSSLFNSTNFDYLMRNIGIDTIIAAGFLTDQCVDHTIRDGADRGYRMICATDACATDTRARHRAALNAFKGYCRMEMTEDLLALIDAVG